MYIILDNTVQHLCVQRHYIIDPWDDAYFFKAFKTRVVKRMQDMYLDIREGHDPNPQWIIEANLRALWDYWKFDKFLEKATKAKANKSLS